MIETVAKAIDELLDGEERDQRAGDGNGCVQRRDRRHRRHPKAREAAQEVEIAEVDQAPRDGQHDNADDDFGNDGRAKRNVL